MEILKNIIIETSKQEVFVYHPTNIIPNYGGTEENIVTFIDKSLLEPELTLLLNEAITDFILPDRTLKLIQYQNISQNVVGYEQFWIIDDMDYAIDKPLYDLSTTLQQQIKDFGFKIIETIQGGNI